MKGINKVILVGTVGKDPEVRYSQAGSANATLSIATNEKWKDKQGQVQERTEWHRLKLFGKLAEIVAEYVKKGQTIYVEGSLRTDKYTDKQGVERYTTDIIVNDMQMLGGKKEAEQGGASGGGWDKPKQAPADNIDPFSDDQVPF